MGKQYYYKKTVSYDYEIAHIYEHLLLHCLRKRLVERGFTLGLCGWVHGTLFTDLILLETHSFSQLVEDEVASFLDRPLKIEDEDWSLALATVSAEYGYALKVIDKLTAKTELEQIDLAPLQRLDGSRVLERFTIRQNKTDKQIIHRLSDTVPPERKNIIFSFQSDNLNELAVVFRLWPIIVDNLQYLINQYGGYCDKITFPEFNDDGSTLEMTLRVSHTSTSPLATEIPNLISTARKKINFLKLREELNQYANYYQSSPYFAHDPENILDDSGILVSRQAIATLFTPENVQHVWGRLRATIS